MPMKLTKDEGRFLKHYVKLGGVAEMTAEAERLARLKAGTGAKMLRLKRVAEAVEKQMAPVRLEQERQRMVADAVAEVTAKMAAETAELKQQLANATQMPPLTVADGGVVIEQELMRLVRLCPEKHGRVKLASIQTALVVSGMIEQGNTKRTLPPENPLAATAGVYTALFERQRLAAGPAGSEVPAAAGASAPSEGAVLEAEVFDIVPPKNMAGVPAPRVQGAAVLPAAGESIAPAVAEAKKPVTRRGSIPVLTVELG